MLDAFASVGATQFDVTWTTCGGAKDGFRRGVRLADLTRALPSMLDDATRKQRNLIVRPHGQAVTFIQLDDLAPPMLARLAPRRVSDPANLAGKFSGVDCNRRSRGQGFCPPPSQRHRSRRDRKRRNARRGEPEFQGQVRAGFSARRYRADASRAKDDTRRTRTAWPGRSAGRPCPDAFCAEPPASESRQPEMAGLRALPSRRAAEPEQAQTDERQHR
jgi:hypothetical protein